MALIKKNQEGKPKAVKKGEGTLPAQTLADHVLRSARMTEKSYALNALGQYVFSVASDATKQQVRRAVETAYGVTVLRVRMSYLPGKKKGFGAKRGETKAVKKAIVTLPSGTDIELFKGI